MAKWKIYLFGAGKKGCYWLRCLKSFGTVPEGFIDNNEAMQGELCEGIPVYGVEKLIKTEFDYVLITCNDEEVIYHQLLCLGIVEHKIIAGYHKLKNYIFYYAINSHILAEGTLGYQLQCSVQQKILFDLQNGMVLGGVEAWSYELAKQLKKQGMEGAYLTIDSALSAFVDKTYPAYIFRYYDCREERERIDLCVRVISENLPCTVVCNFPQYIFWSACIARTLYPNQVRIVAVQHNDDQSYYEAYSLWQNYIDRCIVISSRMKDKQLAYGMKNEKIMHINWEVPCEMHLKRTWSREDVPLRIGYAGRVTVTQKRADLLLETALQLVRKKIDFCLTIAGIGDYSEIMTQRICADEMGSYVKTIGYIDRKEISDFWKGQDIMISCSEWEGHSISQVEAMAAGAVPVITDVSGARDDVTDGYNGFVVSVGDIDRLVEKICFLNQNRDELEHMGRRAHNTICKRQENNNQTVFWDGLLKKVWE